MNGTSKAEDATYTVFKALLEKNGQSLFYEKLTSAARTDLDWGRLATTPQLAYFTRPQSYALELAYLDTCSRCWTSCPGI